jgi:hypothetical protein
MHCFECFRIYQIDSTSCIHEYSVDIVCADLSFEYQILHHGPNLRAKNSQQKSTLEGNLTTGKNKQPAQLKGGRLSAGKDRDVLAINSRHK